MRPKTIMVVEDEILIRMLLADELALSGFAVVQAASAAEALRVLESPVTIDLMVSDIRMPGPIDGLGLAERVRADWPHIKIVLASGHLTALPAGTPAEAFVPKPYEPAAVVRLVQRCLEMGDGDEH